MPELPKIPIISEVERTGTCNRFCGRCCSVARWRTHPLWKERLAPFFAELGENAQGDCAKLVWQNGQAVCSIYETRPAICRDFPNHPLSVSVIPECTYHFRVIQEGG